MELKELDLKQFEEIYFKYLVNDFPKNEVQPFEMIVTLYNENRYSFFGMYEKNEYVGYASVMNYNKYYLLSYYAVSKEKRGKGLGSKALTLLKENLINEADVLILETENPSFAKSDEEKIIQENRIEFYKKNGCIDCGIEVEVYFVEYNLFTLFCNNENINIKEAYKQIYLSALKEERYNSFVKIY